MPVTQPDDRSARRAHFDAATAGLEPPFAIVDLPAFDANAAALTALAAGKTIRLPSKSVRCRALTRRILTRPGWRGVLAFTLAEALWLTELSDDIVLGYPTTDRQCLAKLVADERLAATVTITVDDVAQLDLVDAVLPASRRAGPVRVCMDLDASWRPARGVHLGVLRSPVHRVADVARLAATITARPGFRLVGVMSYEAQIAGVGDAPPGRPLRGALIRAVQAGSRSELLARRGAAVDAVRRYAELEFVNGGGTGSIAQTAADPSVTEIAAGSGLYGPWLFDAYRAWRAEPAALFALPVVRRPDPRTATVLGGGWIGSGSAGPDRQPLPWLPAGLRLIGTEGAGEVQTPLRGRAAADLRIGDRVWFRHAKAGELCEHVNELHLVAEDSIVDTVATYRGDGQAFL